MITSEGIRSMFAAKKLLSGSRDAKESTRLAEERYRVGAGTLTELLDSQAALAQSEADLIDAKWGYRSAFVTFLWTQGLLQIDDDCSQ